MLPKRSGLGKRGSQPPALEGVSDSTRAEPQLESAVREQKALLESYAPAWYTMALHERVETALGHREGHQYMEEVFLEIHALLENYAPTWYGEEVHERGERVLQTLKKHRKVRAKRASG